MQYFLVVLEDFEDLTGFSGPNDLLEDYLQILVSDGLDLKTLQVLGESEPVFLNKFKDLNFNKIQLSDIHINLYSRLNPFLIYNYLIKLHLYFCRI